MTHTPQNLRADVLSKMLLMQSMLAQLPEDQSIHHFVCRGLEDIPGVTRSWFVSESTSSPSQPNQSNQESPYQHRFVLRIDEQCYGELMVQVADEQSFLPYKAYVHNLVFMVAVILEERRQRNLNEQYKKNLEFHVLERTQELINQISEKEAAQIQALQEKSRAERYLEISRAIILELDAEGRVKLINKRGFNVLGYQDDELIGQNWFDLLYSEPEASQRKLKYRQIMAGQSELIENQDIETITKGGQWRVIAWHNTLIHDVQGQVTGMLSSGTDITDRKITQKELSNEKERLRITLRSIGDGVITTDTQGRLLTMNRMAEKLTEWSQHEIETMHLDQIYQTQLDEQSRPVDKLLQEVLRTGEHYDSPIPVQLISRHGTVYTVTESISPIQDKDHTTVGVVLVFRDITEQQKIMNQMQRTDRLNALGVMAGGIAHDFNNLLVPILGYAKMAQMHLTPESPIHTDLEHIANSAQTAKHLVEQILLFSQKSKAKKRNVHLSNLIKEVMGLLRASIPTSVQIIQEIQPNLPPILGDRYQLQQVIMNLCNNAVQAMQEKGVLHIKVSLRSEPPKALNYQWVDGLRFVCIRVQDSGCGIEPEILEHIFEPFYTTREKGPERGTGLGLSVAMSIVEQHGGTIEVESKPSQGSVFVVNLPESKQEQKAVSTKRSSEFVFGNERILLVDDDPVVNLTGFNFLKKLGYKVTSYSDSLKAKEHFSQHADQYDLVMTDYTMPGLSGRELINQVKAIRPDLPAIMITGYSHLATEENKLEWHCDAIVTKPYDPKQLSQIIGKVLQGEAETT